jgi:hypothetical protein
MLEQGIEGRKGGRFKLNFTFLAGWAKTANKRLGHVLEVAQAVQAKRDNRRSQSVPRGDGEPPRKRGQAPGKKAQRALDGNDMAEALEQLQKRNASKVPA